MKSYTNPPRQEWSALTRRPRRSARSITATVRRIISRVQLSGDDALRQLTREIDGVTLGELRVTESEIAQAAAKVSPALKAAIATAKQNIERFHTAQLPRQIDVTTTRGVRCIQRGVAIQRVGLYIPGGSAPLFSTVLMLALPARIAACPGVIICTPTDKSGHIAPEVLYAAAQCGITEIYKVGGAQAIAAMAYGTATIGKVDKIFGPGNRYVTTAKQILAADTVAIDMPAGPSEVMVIADGSARADFVAADLLAQAEHGADSQTILVCRNAAFAKAVKLEIERQIATLPRCDTAAAAIAASRTLIFDAEDDAIEFANLYAPEHLIISTDNAWSVADRITAAGSIFIGNYSPESAGDYASGTNHTLPTSGWARAFGGVSVDSFVRKITYQELTREGIGELSECIVQMAEAEGLQAHANAVKIRLNECKQ